MNPLKTQKVHTDKVALSFIFILSLTIISFLVWWIYFKPTPQNSPSWIGNLSNLNAGFNFLTTTLLLFGYQSIKAKKILRHRNLMLGATLSSACFLFSYLIYHHYHGDSSFSHFGVIRYLYFFILISHILLSVIQVPCILTTLYFAFRSNFESHKKIARWTFPIWLYVSVTGVLIYFFLKF